MWTAVTEAVSNLITQAGAVVGAVMTTEGALAEIMPLFALGVAGSVFMLGFKVLSMFSWGR